jgi:integrase
MDVPSATISRRAIWWCCSAAKPGLRGREIRALQWTDVNLKKRQLRVERNDWRGEVTTTNGNRVRYVPLTLRLAAALKAHRHLRGPRVVCREDGRPFAEHHLTDLLAKVGRRANLKINGRTSCGTRSVHTWR